MPWSEFGTLVLMARHHLGREVYGVEWVSWSAANCDNGYRCVWFETPANTFDYPLSKAESDFEAVTNRLLRRGFRIRTEEDWRPGALPNWRERCTVFDRDHEDDPPRNVPDHPKFHGGLRVGDFYADSYLIPVPEWWVDPSG